MNGVIAPDLVRYWINDTDSIINNRATGLPQELRNSINFKLEPRWEGTLYCGDPDGEHSNGLGPFAGIASINHAS